VRAGDGRLPANVFTGILLAIGASVSFALLDTISKHLTRSYPFPMVAWVRYVVHVLLMTVLLVPLRGRALLATRSPRMQAFRGVCLALASMTFFAALSYLPLAEASAIIAIGPILVSVVAVRWLGERAPPGTWVALTLSFVGMLLIVRPGSSLFTPAALLPVVAACFSTGFTLATRRLALIDDGVSTLYIGGIVATVLLSLFLPFHWVTPRSAWDLALFCATGLIGAVGHLMLVRAYERVNATTVAPFMYANTVAALGLGWLVFDAFPDLVALGGIALILATGVGMALKRRA
jgi:drug/metabolite transporter (DMT)-like permease